MHKNKKLLDYSENKFKFNTLVLTRAVESKLEFQAPALASGQIFWLLPWFQHQQSFWL